MYQPDNYNNYNNYPQGGQGVVSLVSNTMKRVYFKMTLALIVTALTAFWASASAGYINFLVSHQWFMWVLVIAELGFVIALSGAINKLSNLGASALFYLFAIVNGLMLFPIIFAYSGVSIAKTFFITAGVFGAMSVYGYFTNQDLSRFGSILVMCLIGLFIVILVNVFLKSSTLEWIISAVGVLIFIGLTAWDTQQVRRMAESMPGENTGKLATLGALTLYLDFINLFLFLLNFFGNSRN